MSKTISRKLSLKKETLRSLTAEQLGAVAGGTLAGAYYSDKALSAVRPPVTGTCTCETNTCFGYDYNFDGYKMP